MFPSPPQLTISISSFHISTFTSFDDINSKEHSGIYETIIHRNRLFSSFTFFTKQIQERYELQMAVQNRLAHAEEAPEEDTGLIQVDTHCKLCYYSCCFCSSESNHILMLYHALFRCLFAGRVHANTHRSRVLSQGPLVLSPTRYKHFRQGDDFIGVDRNSFIVGICLCIHF